MEILPSKRFESHSQSANGLKRPFRVKNDKYGPCHGAKFYKNDTLSQSQNPENDTLFSGTSTYRKIYDSPVKGLDSLVTNRLTDGLVTNKSSSKFANGFLSHLPIG